MLVNTSILCKKCKHYHDLKEMRRASTIETQTYIQYNFIVDNCLDTVVLTNRKNCNLAELSSRALDFPMSMEIH